MEFEEKTLSRREIYKGPIFQLVQDQLRVLFRFSLQMRITSIHTTILS